MRSRIEKMTYDNMEDLFSKNTTAENENGQILVKIAIHRNGVLTSKWITLSKLKELMGNDK